jgi:predicted RND superfamily exporter protein
MYYSTHVNRKNQLAVGFKKVHEEISKIPLVDRLSKPFQIMEQYVNDEEIGEIFESQSFDEYFINRVHDLGRELRKQETEELNRLCKHNTIPVGLITEFYSSVVPVLGTWWFQNKRTIPAVEMDRYFNQLINQDVFHLKKI